VVNENGETVTVVTKSGMIRANAAKQEVIFTGLPAYAYGKAVTYSATEEEVAGYTASYSALDGTWEDGYRIVVTNTHTTETTEYTVSKVWDDDSNRDGVRPDSVEVKLIGSDGSERVARLAGDDGWNYTFTDLPVYWDEGTKIKYTLEESPVSDYVRAVSEADSENHFTVTNTHEIATIDIPVEKIWDDADDQDGVRAEEITVVLTGSDGTVREAVLTESGDWSYTFANLPVYWNEGIVITYSLQEKEVDGYSDEVIAGEDGYSFTVTNNHIPAVTDVVIVKAWDDDSNRDGIRPETIHVVLSGTDGGSYEADLTKENGYSYLFTGLPVYYNHGTTVAYSVSEDAVEGYETAVSMDETGYIFTVTNTHEPATISIPVTKTWDDNDDQDGLRPESITVTLKASSGVSYGAELSAENGWAYTFEDVFVYYNEGELAEYSLEEMTVDGYETEIATGEDCYSFAVTNTHEPETTEVNVKKIWDDDDNRDGVRADFLHITLNGSDGKSYEADLTEETGWAAVITNLPVYFNHGEKIIYTIAEDDTANYEAELVTTEDGYGFTFTNTHEVAKTDITVTKTWEDAENQDGVRPDEVEVVLTGSDGSRYSAVLTEETEWTYIFTDLPVYWNKGVSAKRQASHRQSTICSGRQLAGSADFFLRSRITPVFNGQVLPIRIFQHKDRATKRSRSAFFHFFQGETGCKCDQAHIVVAALVKISIHFIQFRKGNTADESVRNPGAILVNRSGRVRIHRIIFPGILHGQAIAIHPGENYIVCPRFEVSKLITAILARSNRGHLISKDIIC